MRRHLRKWPARPRRTARFPRFSTRRSRWMPNSCKLTTGEPACVWNFCIRGRLCRQAPTYPLALLGHSFPGYIALYTVILNLVVAVVLTPLFKGMRAAHPPVDQTVTSDYFA